MNNFNVNQLAYQIVSDNVRAHQALANLVDYAAFIFRGKFYNSPDQYCAENLICTVTELEAAIRAVNAEVPGLVKALEIIRAHKPKEKQ